MKKELKITVLAVSFAAFGILPAFAQSKADNSAKPAKAARAVGSNSAQAKKKADKSSSQRVVFAPSSSRDPFLSMEEVEVIEKARLAEQKRLADEKKRLEELERQRRAEAEKQRLYEEDLKRNPARAVMGKIQIDGIVGTDAIINGKFVSKGDTVEGATIVKVSENSVSFVYKGQKFVKKLPLM